MELNFVIIVLLIILGWFVLQGVIASKLVFTHNQDDVHWIAAAAMTSIILFIIGIIFGDTIRRSISDQCLVLIYVFVFVLVFALVSVCV